MTKGKIILCAGEITGGNLSSSTLKLGGAARDLCGKTDSRVCCVISGPGSAGAARALKRSGFDKVFFMETPELSILSDDAYSYAYRQLVRSLKPSVMIFSASQSSKSLAARLAAELETGLMSDAISLATDADGLIKAVKPTYGGKLMAEIASRSPMQMLTLRDGFFKNEFPERETHVEEFQPDFSAFKLRVKSLGADDPVSGLNADITQSEKLLVAGRGVKTAAEFAMIEELSALTGWGIGATRSFVESGMIGEAAQIGITGKTVAPKFYLGLGVSGKMQHSQGFENAGVVAAVNTDPAAPIKDIADYFIQADVKEFLTAFLAEVKKDRGIS